MNTAWSQFTSLPGAQVTLVCLSALVFIVGNHIVFILHDRRVGKSRVSFLAKPFSSLIRFNANEWSALGVVNALAVALLVAALQVRA